MSKLDEIKDKIKQELTIEQVADFVNELGGEPIVKNETLICRTICHNGPGEGSHKLFYYANTQLFKCYTECNEYMDIYQLIMKIKDISYYQAIFYVANYFAIYIDLSSEESLEQLDDWHLFKQYERVNEINSRQIIELPKYDKKIIKYFPRPHIGDWEEEGIKQSVMKKRGICYDPITNGIVIPHYDIDSNLIGIRERTLTKEDEKYGKYRPAIINGKMYNHSLSFNLYNLNFSKDNIKRIKKAIIFEGEKSPLLYASYFGEENDISVAVCGSSLITYQVKLLLSLGVEEIIIAFDRQFQELGDKEFEKWTKKLEGIRQKYSPYVLVSFMFDKTNLLPYKASPIDEGAETFMQMFRERIFL